MQRTVFFLFFFCTAAAHARNPIDSLEEKLKKCGDDSTKVTLLCKISTLKNGISSFKYLAEALQLSETLGYMKGLAQSHYLIGRYYFFRENYSPSLLHCSMALRYAKSLPDYTLAAKSCLYIGYNHFHNEPKTAVEYYNECIKYGKKANDEMILSYAYSAIGNVHEKWEDGKGALGYFLLSLKIREKKGSVDELISSLIETARAYNRNGMLDKSDELVEHALDMAEKTGRSEQNLVYLYQMRGYHFFDREKNYPKALEYFKKAYNLVEKNQWFDRNNINAIRPMAETYFRLGDNTNAARYYNMYFKLNEAELKKIDKELFDAQSLLRQESEKQKFLLKDSEILRQKVKLERTEKQIYLFVFGILVLAGIAFIFYRNARLKEKNLLLLDSKVKSRTAELEQANSLLLKEISEKTLAQNKLSESEIRLTETNKELEAFIYKASHDLKGPLSSSRGLVNLALNEAHIAEREQFIRMIGQSLERLDGILQDLQELTFIRQGKVVLSVTDAEKMIRNTLPNFSGYEQYKNIKFIIENNFKSDFLCDPLLLQSVLRNVLENAVKYSKKNLDSFIAIQLFEEGAWKVIKIRDNGIGISPEFHAKIFDVFFRANDVTKGSGLGLYIVKNAMKKLNGRVELERSVLKEGTVITLYFPVK